MPLQRRKYIPGRYVPARWITLDDQMPMPAITSATPSIDELVPLIQELILLEHPDDPPAGLMELSGSNVITWLTDRISELKATTDDTGSSDAATEFRAMADGIPQQRLQIAKSVAARRGIKLADALKHVP